MDSKKRERAANFNIAEVQLLVSLVDKYKIIIENKKTDAVTNKDKESAWRKVENTFNSCGISTSVRSWKTLKLKYEAIKKNTKKKCSLQRQEMYRTGGGPSHAPDFDDVEEKVMSICSNIKGLEARHDSDTIPTPTLASGVVLLDSVKTNYLDTAESNTPIQAQDLDIIQSIHNSHAQEINKICDLNESLILDVNEEDNESQKENKWDRWNPKALKTRVSNVLRADTASKANVTTKLDKLSTARLELVELQMETVKKEQQFLEEKHKLQMLHLANDEKRKQEIHEILLKKISSGPVTDIL